MTNEVDPNLRGLYMPEIDFLFKGTNVEVRLDDLDKGADMQEVTCIECKTIESQFPPTVKRVLNADSGEEININTRLANAIIKEAKDQAQYVCASCAIDQIS